MSPGFSIVRGERFNLQHRKRGNRETRGHCELRNPRGYTI
jgi:hypothetical protein